MDVLEAWYYAFWQASREMNQMQQFSHIGRFLVNFAQRGSDSVLSKAACLFKNSAIDFLRVCIKC